ncbi:MAG: amino acid adenylation domain-containing protein [Tildeniella torsiva UHER 1998/13D]|jgi:amino acid adenylation domain-containing protein|nr:amino acid adenylation domain-containing protein [Tildeniella torsiva UHER 1998/13D]
MNDLSQRIAALSPAQRSLLEQTLKQRQAVAPSISVATPDSTYPLSFAQRRLWFLHQLAPACPLYNLAAVVQLHGQLRADVLEHSLNEVQQRHAILRSRFMSRAGEPRQVILPWQPMAVPLIDLQGLTEEEQQFEIQRQSEAIAHYAFDLSQEEPMRLVLLRLAPEEHRLLVVMHHIVSDGWSKGLLIQEVATLYQAFLAGQPSPLPARPIQYKDFAVWQQQANPEFETHLAYWQQQLSGPLPLLQLPMGSSASSDQASPGRLQEFSLPTPLAIALQQFSQRGGVTLFMTLLAAFQVLLYRYSGQTDLCIGTPTAGRSQPQLESLIGCFINPVVLRSDLSGNPDFRTFLHQMQTTATDAYSHSDLPFETLVEALQPDRTTTPLFQAMFALQNVPRPSLELSELTLEVSELHSGTAKFDLTLAMEETAPGLIGTVEYRSDRFDDATITRFCQHFQTLLDSIVAYPDRRLLDLELLPAAERQQLLVDWNQTALPLPECSIHALFEQQVERSPDAIALVFDEQQLTYRELNQQANQLAHYLHTLGIESEARVGICLERSPLMVIALLGILKAGAAYVPLDPNFPADRLRFMVQDSQLALLVTQSSLMAAWMTDLETSPQPPQILRLDTTWAQIAQSSQDNPLGRVSPTSLAYVIYTSGSTGQPKGVMIEHQSVVNFLLSLQHHLQLTAHDRLLAVTTLSFDIAVLELLLPLTVGAQVAIAPQAAIRDAQQLIAALETHQATVMQATPATWRMLLSAGWAGKADLTLLSGGEALPSDLANQLLTKGKALWNLYGPTETTVWSTLQNVTSTAGGIAIGRPIHNTQVYVLDEMLQPVPVGVAAELYIGGAGLARGYWQWPELTAERFIPHPFTAHSRLYKTGDLARYRADGTLEHLGRLDHQVKLRSYRIELGEIEAVLRQQPEIKDVVVVAQGEPGDQRLVAYGVFLNKPSQAELRERLRSQLPDYMVPSVFVSLEALPLTPNDKVDRQALPEADAQPEPTVALVPPQTLTEQQLSQIWATVLKTSDLSIHHNFFELGGHSLLATQMIAQVYQQFQVELPLRRLFDFPTIAGLASQIDELRSQQPVATAKIQRVSRQAYRH